MIRLQDIAEMAGVSRTTVSNVINGNTKRVSQATIDKITAILKERNYVPHMGSVMLSGHGSRIIGVVLGFSYAHGMQSLQDPFVGELDRNYPEGNRRKRLLRHAHRRRKHPECSGHCFQMERRRSHHPRL